LTIKKTAIFLAAVLVAAGAVLVAGLAVIPSTVQNAQANPCSGNTLSTAGGVGERPLPGVTPESGDIDFKCDLNDVEVDEFPGPG